MLVQLVFDWCFFDQIKTLSWLLLKISPIILGYNALGVGWVLPLNTQYFQHLAESLNTRFPPPFICSADLFILSDFFNNRNFQLEPTVTALLYQISDSMIIVAVEVCLTFSWYSTWWLWTRSDYNVNLIFENWYLANVCWKQ